MPGFGTETYTSFRVPTNAELMVASHEANARLATQTITELNTKRYDPRYVKNHRRVRRLSSPAAYYRTPELSEGQRMAAWLVDRGTDHPVELVTQLQTQNEANEWEVFGRPRVRAKITSDTVEYPDVPNVGDLIPYDREKLAANLAETVGFILQATEAPVAMPTTDSAI